jgi:hypothetical protein
MTQVINLILDALVEHLTATMQTAIETDDLTYADIVKKGLLQSDKTKKNIQLGVIGGDHDTPEMQDGIVTLRGMPNVGIEFNQYPREIGGGQLWWRRGIVKVDCYFVREKLNEDDAHDAAYEVLGRLMNSIENMSMTGLVDDYDERAIKMFCYGNTFFESGGPPKTYIFSGKVLWCCLTERP